MTSYPGADQSRRYDRSYPGQVYRGGPSKGVLHTTETSGLPGYNGGGNAPHFTVIPNLAARSVTVFQHFDTDRPSRALQDLAGGIQTNNDGVIQIELAGTCSRYGPGLFWPEAPTWVLDDVRALVRWVNQDRGIPFIQPPRGWLDYPSSYGPTRVRMSQKEWDNYAGWCGHQHVPENDHGDPGDMAPLFTGEQDMALDADDKRWLTQLVRDTVRTESYRGVWRTDDMMAATDPTDDNPAWWPERVLTDLAARVKGVEAWTTPALTDEDVPDRGRPGRPLHLSPGTWPCPRADPRGAAHDRPAAPKRPRTQT